ncbi:hypothetical protein PV10_02863 [Exophiala mesophila]|uniref:Uncharacterized protein n=1 Tax=Exophiala mesophila TaxID=212818 RepID=A0A0D1ZKL8_EXOME|nr:uncharacterized protein PV10_02863 [Exophiala mesophila]KIV95182.1 hypothetical protein PV10_02863 [Exophiala mesophila]
MAPSELRPQRTNSKGSLRSFVSGLWSTKSNSDGTQRYSAVAKDQSPTQEQPQAEPELDQLPDSREGLEGRLNYHLSELDRLRRMVAKTNEHMKEAMYRLDVQEHLKDKIPYAYRTLYDLAVSLRMQRDSYKPFVAFHRGEIIRIARAREELDQRQGIEVRESTRAMYKKLDRGPEWAALFS